MPREERAVKFSDRNNGRTVPRLLDVKLMRTVSDILCTRIQRNARVFRLLAEPVSNSIKYRRGFGSYEAIKFGTPLGIDSWH